MTDLRLTNEKTWRALGRYLRDLPEQTARGNGLIVQGPVGTGKTSILALVAEAEGMRAGIWSEETEAQRNGFEEKRPRVCFVSAVELAGLLMQRGRDEWTAKRLRWYQTCAHLMLDDFGTEYLDAYGLNGFYQLIDRRYTRRVCTHLTLNTTLDNYATTNAAAERILSRLRQRCYTLVVVGEDRRQRLALAALETVDFDGRPT